MTYPINPPPELVQQWCAARFFGCPDKLEIAAYELVRFGAEYGADQELEACCKWLESEPDPGHVDLLRRLETVAENFCYDRIFRLQSRERVESGSDCRRLFSQPSFFAWLRQTLPHP